MLKNAKYVAAAALVGASCYHSGILALSSIANEINPPIHTQVQLEQAVAKEAESLGCMKRITALLEGRNGAVAYKTGTEYVVSVGGDYATYSSVRHEVYHICDGHADTEPTMLRYWFWGEPQAILYDIFRVRL